jgi:hypothetical protein
MIPHRKWHRAVFVAAGLYNIGWGIYAAFDPQWVFRYAGMPAANYPELFACLGMVVGLYGILYFEVARRPEQGWLLAAVGFVGKVLGPLGWLVLVWRAAWPARTVILCLPNDAVWWVPFGLYLYDAWPCFHGVRFGSCQSSQERLA